ncbi:MAG: ComF family protein [Burkholderiaceae bacterium]|jgi:ComF family protein|nr:ComF family protein [Burkholderiaceae bacterium]
MTSPPPSARGAAGRGLGTVLRRLLSPRCLMCATVDGDPLCSTCAATFFPRELPRCRACAQRLGPAVGSLCGGCLREPPGFDATLALADYAPPIDGLVVALKFGHQLEIASSLGRLLAPAVASIASPSAVLVAVPLAFERQRDRGFNQALEIARAVARITGLPLRADALMRTRHRPAQEGLSRDERRRNVRGAFAVPAPRETDIAGHDVVVIDDVMTSGSTLDEVARTLKRAGAVRVLNAVVARTP